MNCDHDGSVYKSNAQTLFMHSTHGHDGASAEVKKISVLTEDFFLHRLNDKSVYTHSTCSIDKSNFTEAWSYFAGRHNAAAPWQNGPQNVSDGSLDLVFQ